MSKKWSCLSPQRLGNHLVENAKNHLRRSRYHLAIISRSFWETVLSCILLHSLSTGVYREALNRVILIEITQQQDNSTIHLQFQEYPSIQYPPPSFHYYLPYPSQPYLFPPLQPHRMTAAPSSQTPTRSESVNPTTRNATIRIKNKMSLHHDSGRGIAR